MTPAIPIDYEERVYAGVLGKLIGVYLGRPFEQWSHERIAARWGEIRRYVNADQGMPLIVTDDDITGTFTFLRALLDHDSGPALSSREIGESWLNYIAENRHILWWGGMGMSTEHTAYLRLKAGVPAPQSGSIALNGRAVAEEIGAQIFIDGWALVSPNNPEQAARLAGEAARVSHDGEAVHGAVMIAAMEALAFGEADIDALVDGALSHLPGDCEIAGLIADLRGWHQTDADWRRTLARLREKYGYARYGTNCPMVTNHGVIILALLYGGGDFDESMMIVNTAGHDTDCNSGNLGCLLGIRNGLATFRGGYDWRTPVNDRLFLPSADGHWGVIDAANLALRVAGIGRSLAGEPARAREARPRYGFDLPGCTHGLAASDLCPRDTQLTAAPDGGVVMRVLAEGLRTDAEIATFVPPEALGMPGYAVTATPTLYPGQQVMFSVEVAEGNRAPVVVRPFVRAYGGGPDGAGLVLVEGPPVELVAGRRDELRWEVPETAGAPVAKVGLSTAGVAGSEVTIRAVDWGGTPRVTFALPDGIRSDRNLPNNPWSAMFMNGVSRFHARPGCSFNIMQDRGRGILHTGAEDWRDLSVEAVVRPFLAAEFGLAVRVQGLRRYYALLLGRDGKARLVRNCQTDTTLATAPFSWTERDEIDLRLVVEGRRLRGIVNGRALVEAEDRLGGLDGGGVGFVVSEGRIEADYLRVGPAA